MTDTSKALQRKVGVTHMAFYRGWLQGLPLRDMADAYLETGLDLRLAKSTLSWVQDELRRAALRHGRHGEARLLRLRITDVHTVSGQSAELPSIDDFREDFDPGSFYSYDELMTHYLERYPQAGDDRARKRARLLERQLRTLNWLEALLVTAPVPADPVRAWLDPNIVARLHNGGIGTLGDLMKRIAEHGFHWYNTVPQMGATRAARLVKWVTDYAGSLGPLPASATTPPQKLTKAQTRRPLTELPLSGHNLAPPALAGAVAVDGGLPSIVPLEAMLLPRSPSGQLMVATATPAEIRNGSRIEAANDREAIESWLNVQAAKSDATYRAYRKEAERLLLWAAHERGMTFGDLSVDDCAAYRNWLCNLGRVDDAAWPFNLPQQAWFAPRYVKRHSPAWRPFEGPLSPKSVHYALTVCRSLFRWLNHVRYLAFDPWVAVAGPGLANTAAGDEDEDAPDTELTRVLSREDWSCVMATVDAIPDEAARLRAKLLFRLALVTGLRIAELAGARYKARSNDRTKERSTERIYAKPLRNGTGTRWMLKVRGKGAKWRSVPLTDDVLQLMRENLRQRKLPDDPRMVPEGTPVLARLVREQRPGGRRVLEPKRLKSQLLGGDPMTPSGIAQLVKQVFERAAQRLKDAGEHDHAKHLQRASTHWIRHTTGSFLGNSGAPPSQIQQLLGHVSIATTSIYTSTGEDELYGTVKDVFSSS